MNIAPNPLVDALTTYQSAVFAKDLDAFIALYAPDIHVFDMWGDWSVQGIESWRDQTRSWFDSLGAERVVVTIDDVSDHRSADLVAGHATLTYAAVSAEGQELRSLQNRLSLILRQSGQGWQIVHQHTSAPIDFETMKPRLRRE